MKQTDEKPEVLLMIPDRRELADLERDLSVDFRIQVIQGRGEAELLFDREAPELVLARVDMAEQWFWNMYGDIPVIALAFRNTQEEELWALEQGAADYIHHPFHTRLVTARIRIRLQITRERSMMMPEFKNMGRGTIGIRESGAGERRVLYFTDRLKERLRDIPVFPATLMIAPSGFGKTTAVRKFFQEAGGGFPVFMVILINENPVRQWKRICERIMEFDPPAGSRLVQMGYPDEEIKEQVADVIYHLRTGSEIYFLIDNFQEIQTGLPDPVIRALIHHLEPRIHVILISQINMNYRERGTLYGNCVNRITMADLSLTPQDIGLYFEAAGHPLKSGQARSIYEATSGWMSAVYLVLLKYQKSGKIEPQSKIGEMIETLFIGRLRREELQFLLSISVFDGITREQAAYMTGTKNGIGGYKLAPYGEDLLENNSFAYYDGESGAYYYHNLFREVITYLFENQPWEFRQGIYKRAAEWYAGRKEYFTAISWYRKFGAYEAILGLPLKSADFTGQPAAETKEIVLELIQEATTEMKEQHLMTYMVLTFVLFTAGAMEPFGKCCAFIEDTLKRTERYAKQQHQRLTGEYTFMRGITLYNDLGLMGENFKNASRLLDGRLTALINRKGSWTFGVPSILYMFYREDKPLSLHLREMEDVMPCYTASTDGHGNAADVIMKAECRYMSGQMEEVRELCYHAQQMAEMTEQESILLCVWFLRVRLALFEGKKAEAAMFLKKLHQIGDECANTNLLTTRMLIYSFYDIELGNLQKIPEWLRTGGITVSHLRPLVIPFANILYARILIEQKRWMECLQVIPGFVKQAEVFHYAIVMIYCRIFEAIARENLGDMKGAETAMLRAWSIAGADGIYMPFAENRRFTRSLWKRMKTRRMFSGEVMAWLEQLSEQYERGLAEFGKEEKESPKAELTQREWELVNLAVEGYSNQEIGEMLGLGCNTVKTKMYSIFQKTGVKRRTQLWQLSEERNHKIYL